jgi:hypothetical protein
MLNDPHIQLSDHEQRINALESRILSLEAALTVKEQLGGELIEREPIKKEGVEEVTGQEPLPVDEPTNTSYRVVMSEAAATSEPKPLHRNFRPSLFGYHAEDFKRDYPDVNPGLVLESFFSHHVGKGDRSKNWLEKFWSYAARAQQIEKEKRMSNPVETDSMGLPTDRKARNEMLGK